MTNNWAHIDYKSKLPLVMGDWRELQRKGITLTKLREVSVADDPGPMMEFVAYVLDKALGSGGGDIVSAMSMTEFAALGSDVMSSVLDAEGVAPDRPTSSSSTSSPPTTDGAGSS